MKRALATLAVLVLVTGAGAVRADSFPLAGSVHGIELCAEFMCGKAIFAGVFQGRLGFNPHAIGTIVVAVKHEDLPPPGGNAAITSGNWQILAGLQSVGGTVTGNLHARNELQFDVTATLSINNVPIATFVGLLDHNFFPPHIDGVISQ